MKLLQLAPLLLFILPSCSEPTKEEISDMAYEKCESIPVSKLYEWAKCMRDNDPNFTID